MDIANQFINFITDLFYPKFCCGCQKFGSYLCPSCQEMIEFLLMPIEVKISDPALDLVISATKLSFPMKQLIHECKYQGVQGIGAFCAQLIYYTTSFPKTQFITSIPLEPKREDERGFNQAKEIAVALASLTHTSYQDFLYRNKFLTAQATLHHSTQRALNIQQAFSPTADLLKLHPPPETVLIVDDVVTTGATLNEAAQILKKNGVREVFGLTVCHGQ